MKIALDVALIPDEKTMNRAIEVNQELLAQRDGEIRLGRLVKPGVGLPHVSLCMFFAYPSSLPEVEQALEELNPGIGPILGVINSLIARPNKHGSKTISFALQRSNVLASLHEKAMRAFMPHFVNPGTLEHFIQDDDIVRQGDADWVNSYETNGAHAAFDPHITLGFGELQRVTPDEEVRFHRLGLYRLGACCTCREEIASFKLENK